MDALMTIHEIHVTFEKKKFIVYKMSSINTKNANANNAASPQNSQKNSVATILANTATNAQTKARLSLVTKQLKDRLNLGALSTTQLIKSLKEFREIDNKILSIKFPMKPDDVKTLSPYPLENHLYLSLGKYSSAAGLFFGFDDEVRYKFDSDNEDEYTKQYKYVEDTVEEYNKIVDNLKYRDRLHVSEHMESIGVQVDLTDDNINVVNYLFHKFLDTSKEPTVKACESLDSYTKCTDDMKNEVINIVKSWSFYHDIKKGGGAKKSKVIFEKKVRKVYSSPDGKYILKNKAKVFLSSIRGKYRYT